MDTLNSGGPDKFIGVLGGAWAAVKVFKCRLGEGVKWVDMAAVAILCGCGFTVSLLIAELAFADNLAQQELVKTGVLVGSFVSAVVSAIMLQLRSSAVRKRRLLEQ